MIVDLYIHTSRYSRCSILNPSDLIQQAKVVGLDGLAITEHDRLWSQEELTRLKEEAGVNDLVLLRGVEIEREWMHLLVFNYPHEIGRHMPLREVVDEVHGAGGVVVLAHPFRYGRLLDSELEDLRDLFCLFDAVEILTPHHAAYENQRARALHERLHLVGIGGSDSHDIDQVGRCVTYFSVSIRDEGDLAQAIRERHCSPRFGDHSLQRLGVGA